VFITKEIDTHKMRSVASHVLSIGIIIGPLFAFGWVASGAIHVMDSLAPIRWMPLVGAIALQLGLVFALMFVWERLLGMLWPPVVHFGQERRNQSDLRW
jgi:hypothetical protein